MVNSPGTIVHEDITYYGPYNNVSLYDGDRQVQLGEERKGRQGSPLIHELLSSPPWDRR